MVGVSDYKTVKEKVEQYLKAETLHMVFYIFTMLSFFIGFIIAYFIAFIQQGPIEVWQFFVIVFSPPILMALPTLHFKKKRYSIKIEDSEWTQYYLQVIRDILTEYSIANTPHKKNDSRKKVVKKSQEFLSIINDYWTTGDFQLSIELFKKPITQFKENIKHRLIPALKTGNDDELRKIKKIIDRYFIPIPIFNLDKIKNLNAEFHQKLDLEKADSLLNKLQTSIMRHRLAKHLAITLILILVSIAFYQFSVISIEIPKEYAYGGAITIFVTFFGIYGSKQWKNKSE